MTSVIVYSSIIAMDQDYPWVYPETVTIRYLVVLPDPSSRNTQYKATDPTV